jgi:hypothetical protein
MLVRGREEPELRCVVEPESEARRTHAHGGGARARPAPGRRAGVGGSCLRHCCHQVVTARRGLVSAAWPLRAMQTRDSAQ